MAIHRLETTSDLLAFLFICSGLTVLGMLLMIFQSPPLALEQESYRQVSGRLAKIESSGHSRNSAWANFRLENDPQLYRSTLFGVDNLARDWIGSQTRLGFFIPLSSKLVPEQALEVYGLSIDGMAPSLLEADIALANQRRSPWAGLFPLSLGLLGYGIAWLTWRRR